MSTIISTIPIEEIIPIHQWDMACCCVEFNPFYITYCLDSLQQILIHLIVHNVTRLMQTFNFNALLWALLSSYVPISATPILSSFISDERYFSYYSNIRLCSSHLLWFCTIHQYISLDYIIVACLYPFFD